MRDTEVATQLPKFSVLMSVYKNEKPEWLRESLDSILHQTVMPGEIVMVKDGPLTEDLEQVLNEYSNKYDLFTFIPLEKNHGLGLALREGVPKCRYEWIARMDTDDIARPERFEVQLKYLQSHPDIALLGTGLEEFSHSPLEPDSKTLLPERYEDIVRFAKKRNPLRHVTVMMRKTAVLDSGNYGDFLWFEDYDLFIRMLQHGYKAANLSNILMSVRTGKDMFARRGGWKYVKQDIRFQNFLYHTGYIGHVQYIMNLCTRVPVRLMPNSMRSWIYKIFLRSKA